MCGFARVKYLGTIALMSGYTTRPQQQHKPAVPLPVTVEPVSLSFVMLSRTLLVAEDIKCMYYMLYAILQCNNEQS